MILSLSYEDITGSAVRGEVNGKSVNFFMRVKVNESNIEEALTKLKGNKWVVAFDYVGDPEFLKTVDIGDSVVIITKEVEKLDMNVDFLLNGLDRRVRVVLKLPKTYTDMKSIYDYSRKYPNVRFCGGKFLRLEGCNIGCIGQSDVFRKVPDSKLSIVSEGCSCVFQNIHIDDLDVVEFYDSKTSVSEKKVKSSSNKPKAKSKPKPKKHLSSLLALVNNSDGFDNF